MSNKLKTVTMHLDDDVWAECQRLGKEHGTINEGMAVAHEALKVGDDARIERLEAQLQGVMNSLAASQQEVERLRAKLVEPDLPRPPRLNKRERAAQELAASDLTAQVVERDDIEYGHHETLPRGEHVANVRPWKRGPRQKGDKQR